MRDQAIWSIYLGRWRGVSVRIHMFFLLFGLFTLYLSYLAGVSNPQLSDSWLGVASLLTLLGSVAWHEMGHVAAARGLGGHVDQVILGPVGGLVAPRMPESPVAEMLILVAGPVANALVCGLCAVAMAVLHVEVSLTQLLSPLAAVALASEDRWEAGLQLVFSVNWFLLLINLIPAFPFDGGRALRAMLVALTPRLRDAEAVERVATVARAFSLGLLCVAWLQRNQAPVAGVPVWFGLVLLAIFIFFSARREEVQMTESQWLRDLKHLAPPSPEEPASVLVGVRRRLDAWRLRRRELQRERQLELDQREDAHVDEILERVHAHGMQGLSADEQAILRRASRRYRNRRV